MNNFSNTRITDVIGSVLNASSNKEFSLRAFEDYTQKKINNYQNLIVAVEETIASVPDDDDSEFESIDSSSEKISSIIEQYCGGDQYVLLNEGYVRLSDLLTGIYNQTGLSADPDSEITDESEFIDTILPSGRAGGSYSINGVIEDIKGSLHSCTVLLAGTISMKAKEVADRITLFRDELGKIFGSAMQDISSSAESMMNIVHDATDGSDFMSKLTSFIGLNQLAEDESDVAPVNTDACKYTGASPMSALSFDTVNTVAGVVGTVVNVAVKAVAAVCVGVFNFFKRIFHKAVEAVNRLVGDPYDLKVRDSKAEANTIDGFVWRIGNWNDELGSLPFFRLVLGHAGGGTYEENLKLAQDIKFTLVSSQNDQFYMLKQMGFEIAIQFRDVVITTNASNDVIMEFYVIFQFKPLPLNPKHVNNLYHNFGQLVLIKQNSFGLARYQFNYRQDYGNLERTYNDVISYISRMWEEEDLYLNEKSSERELYSAFCASFYFTIFIQELCFQGSEDTMSGYATNLNDVIPNYITSSIGIVKDASLYEASQILNIADIVRIPDVVTNNDFLVIASGWTKGTGDFSNDFTQFTNYDAIVDSSDVDTLSSICDILNIKFKFHLLDYAKILVANQIDQTNYPLDFPFVPYRFNSESWSSSRYAIKTDEENVNAFNNFINTIIIVAVAVAAAAIIGFAVKRIARFIALKKESKLKFIAGKMTRGEKLSGREKRAYYRSMKKSKLTKKVESGLNSAAAANSDQESLDLNYLLSEIKATITGVIG